MNVPEIPEWVVPAATCPNCGADVSKLAREMMVHYQKPIIPLCDRCTDNKRSDAVQRRRRRNRRKQ